MTDMPPRQPAAAATREAHRRRVTFDEARARAYGLLGDAADWMRGWPQASAGQGRAVSRFFQAIDAAKAALNDAARAADTTREGAR